MYKGITTRSNTNTNVMNGHTHEFFNSLNILLCSLWKIRLPSSSKITREGFNTSAITLLISHTKLDFF
ncbi:unnamed protein product [Brassica oleracea var. botrytis]